MDQMLELAVTQALQAYQGFVTPANVAKVAIKAVRDYDNAHKPDPLVVRNPDGSINGTATQIEMAGR